MAAAATTGVAVVKVRKPTGNSINSLLQRFQQVYKYLHPKLKFLSGRYGQSGNTLDEKLLLGHLVFYQFVMKYVSINLFIMQSIPYLNLVRKSCRLTFEIILNPLPVELEYL